MSLDCENECCGGKWHSVRNEPPPEGLVVQVKNNEGASLKRKGSMWFIPDGSMYVYYTPEFWRPIPKKGKK